MDYSYLYEFNKERYKKAVERSFACKEELGQTVVEDGYLLPNRFANDRLFGHGGVLDAAEEFVKASEITAYAKYAVTTTPEDEAGIYLGEGYEIDKKNVPYIDEEVVYLGYINNHWGHFLIDCSTRLYSFLNDAEGVRKYAYLVNEGEQYVPAPSIIRFLELLGIKDRVIFVNQVTRCRKIIIPEQGYMTNSYYSKGYLEIFDRVAECVDCTKYPSYEKVYYSRANVKKAQGSEIGEEILLGLFEKNGFHIVSPEKYSLDEQISIVRNADLLAGITGTLPHNLLFAKPGQKMLVINKSHNLNMAQMDINAMREIRMTYVDAYLEKFPVMIGPGPFLLDYSNELDAYVKAQNWKALELEELAVYDRKRNSQIYEKWYRLKNIRNLKLHFEKDITRFDYFPPEHLVQYQEAFYHLNEPAKIGEKIKVFIERVERLLKRIFRR